MDRMIYTALNSLSNSRFDQRVNAQNLANLNVPGFKKDLSTVRASTFLANMDQYQSRYFAQASQETLQDENISAEEAMATTSDVQTVLEDKAADMRELTDQQLEALAKAAQA